MYLEVFLFGDNFIGTGFNFRAATPFGDILYDTVCVIGEEMAKLFKSRRDRGVDDL